MAIRSVLFVCAGNICRSPLAEGLFRKMASSRPALAVLEIGSAGTIAWDGNRATPETRRVALEEFGIDLASHSARNIEGLDADLILTMDGIVTQEVKRLKPKGRVLLLGEYAGDGEIVVDPYGCEVDVYRECAAHLGRLVKAAVDRIQKEVDSVSG